MFILQCVSLSSEKRNETNGTLFRSSRLMRKMRCGRTFEIYGPLAVINPNSEERLFLFAGVLREILALLRWIVVPP